MVQLLKRDIDSYVIWRELSLDDSRYYYNKECQKSRQGERIGIRQEDVCGNEDICYLLTRRRNES